MNSKDLTGEKYLPGKERERKRKMFRLMLIGNTVSGDSIALAIAKWPDNFKKYLTSS